MPKILSDLEAAMNHKYRVVSGGTYVPGVTTVINVIDKPALAWSAAQIAAETALKENRRKSTIVRRHRKTLTALGKKEREMGYNGTDDEVFIHYCRGEHRRQWDAKMNRGSRVHDVAERWTKGESVAVLPEDSGFVDALESFYRDYRPVFHLVEQVVLSQYHEYGGRFDIVATLDGPGAQGTFMGDYKTGGHYELPLAMQQSAYMNGRLGVYDDEKLVSFEDLPPLDGARGIYLKEDGTVEVVNPFTSIPVDAAYEGFLACLELFKAVKSMEKLGEKR